MAIMSTSLVTGTRRVPGAILPFTRGLLPTFTCWYVRFLVVGHCLVETELA